MPVPNTREGRGFPDLVGIQSAKQPQPLEKSFFRGFFICSNEKSSIVHDFEYRYIITSLHR